MNRCGKPPDSGFTLVELILVMVIIVILSVAAVTRMNLSDRDLQGVAKELRAHIQLAQELAMTRGSGAYGFRVCDVAACGGNLDSRHYEIFDGVPGNPVTDPLTRGNLIVNISPVTFGANTPTITFQDNGLPDIAAAVAIVLNGPGGSRILTVFQNTGAVVINGQTP